MKKVSESIKVIQVLILSFALMFSFAFVSINENQIYKCMIQMMNYSGEKAYVIVSLITPEGEYEKTLYVQGDDEEWYPDLKKWWTYSSAKNENIDAITGATIGNGERNVISLSIDKKYLDSGYKLRFESAVENQNYHVTDTEVNLDTKTITNKVGGKGYIRYVRILPN